MKTLSHSSRDLIFSAGCSWYDFDKSRPLLGYNKSRFYPGSEIINGVNLVKHQVIVTSPELCRIFLLMLPD